MQDAVQIANRAWAGSQQFWQGLGSGRRVAVIAVATFALALLALFVLWARTPDYVAVYSKLSDEQAGAIVAKLKEMKVPYQVRDGGIVLVPREQVHDARMQLATAGLPQGGGVGFELFDQTSFGLTDFAQKINYQRALEGELSRTINRLDAVEQARVHIVIPQPSLYTDSQKDATASVVLHLRPGRRLSRSQLRGIAQLVAGSVEGLKPENLTIVEGDGNVLSDHASQDGADPASSLAKVDAQNAYEARLADSLQGMLNRVVGPNRASVHVSATLDWDKVEQNSEIFGPDGQKGQIRSQHEMTEAYTGGGRGQAGGIPGVDSNVPTYQATDPTKDATVGEGALQRKDSTINYEVSRRTEHVIRAPGSVKRLSIAVVVDSETVPAERVEALKEVVSAAAGLSQARGDVITVTALPFERADAQSSLEAARQQDLILSIARIAAVVLSPLLILGFLWLILRPRRKVTARELPKASSSLLASAGEPALALATAGTPAALLAKSEEERERDQVRQEIFALARDNPAKMSQLIQTWLEEDRQ